MKKQNGFVHTYISAIAVTKQAWHAGTFIFVGATEVVPEEFTPPNDGNDEDDEMLAGAPVVPLTGAPPPFMVALSDGSGGGGAFAASVLSRHWAFGVLLLACGLVFCLALVQ